jgi:CHAT domain-containing protein
MALSQMILGPVAGQLGQKRLLIVGDGFLQYLPFSTLPTPEAKTATLDINSVTNGEPLLVNHEIVSLPSASMLEVIRHNPSDLPQPTKTLAVLADPVFSPTDERLTRTLRKTNSPTKHVPSVSPDATNTPLNTEFTPVQPLYSRLRATAQEAKQILETLPASEKLEKMGFAASRQAAISPELRQYRILHFATHGILNTQNPERSGIVLSTFDRQGQLLPRSVLSTPDVFNLKLAADLVVLSGCRTGLGKEVKGEGLVGLTGGFMYAGAKRVLVSLWSVDDEPASELMARFYRGMFKDKLSPAKALRAAQLSMWRDPQWQLPYYWAAFTLQGDWK